MFREVRRLIYVNDRFDLSRLTLSQAAYYLSRFEALAAVARKKGFALVVRDRHTPPRAVLDEKPDGVILTVFGHGPRAETERKAFDSLANQVPSVFWGSRPETPGADYVGPDENMGISEILDRLTSMGYRRFGFFGPLDEAFTRERFEAFRRWHQKKRLALPAEWAWPYDVKTGLFVKSARLRRQPATSDDRYYQRQVRTHGAHWLSLPQNALPEIILCDTDTTARHLIREWGGTPGKDMPGIVGYDDLTLPMEPWGWNWLSTVRYDFASQARAVIHLLERRWKTPGVSPQEIRVPSHAVIRTTSLPPVPGKGGVTAEAILDFLKNNYRDPDVSDLAARNFGLTVAAMQRRFSRALGTGWQQAVETCRVESAARDLLATKRTVTEIYLDNGYRHHANFAAAFRRRFGLAPEAYRRGGTGKKIPHFTRIAV